MISMKNSKSLIVILFLLFNLSMLFADTLVVPSITVQTTNTTTASTPIPTNAHSIIITANQIKASGASNLQQVLNGLVGLQVNDLTGDGSQMSVSMRGFGANATQNSLILLNGMPLINPDLGSPDLSQIPVSDIKEIQVFNGSEGVLFGDQAVGGVINIITQAPINNSTYGNLSLGSYNAEIFQAGFNLIGANQLYANMNVRQENTDNYRAHNQTDSEQAYGNIGQQNTNAGWNFYYNLENQLQQLAGALTAAQVAQNRQQAQNNINYSNNRNGIFQFQQYDWFNPNWQERLQLMHNQFNSDGVLFDPYSELEETNWGQISLIGLIHSVMLTNGINIQNQNYHLNATDDLLDDNTTEVSLFSQANLPLTKKLNFIVGARGAEQEGELNNDAILNTDYSAFASTLGLTYQQNANIQLFLRRATSFRFPKADENALTATDDGLKPQTGVSYETGMNMKEGPLYGTLSGFILDLKNELAFNSTPTPLNPFGVNTNLDPTQRIGALFNLNDNLKSTWTIGGQYTHVNATYSSGMFQGNAIPFVASNLGSLYSNYQFWTYWNAFVKVIYVGSQYADGDNANVYPKMPATTVVNFTLRYQQHNVFATFAVNNIFNRLYNAYETINTVSTSPFEQQAYFYPAPGRNFLMTIGFNLT